jgi:hypothetical protein
MGGLSVLRDGREPFHLWLFDRSRGYRSGKIFRNKMVAAKKGGYEVLPFFDRDCPVDPEKLCVICVFSSLVNAFFETVIDVRISVI